MTDLISRQAAIDTVAKHFRIDNDLLEVIVYEMERLPSTQPEIIRCRDCKWKNRHNCTRAVEVPIDDDKYCAWAERRTE